MKDQHKKISGYRDLTQEEIDLMNEAKHLEARVLELHDRIRGKLLTQQETGETDRILDSNAHRWLAIGRTDIETGFMAIVRSVAQPLPRK